MELMSKETGTFTYINGNPEWDNPRWITHDPNGHFGGQFEKEGDAIAACDRWNARDGKLVTMDWEDAPEGASDSHRGFYTIRVAGTSFERVVTAGWHSMEAAANMIQKLRDAVAKHGIEAVRDTLMGTSPYMR